MPVGSRVTCWPTHSPVHSAFVTCGSVDVAQARRESLSNVAAIAVSGWPSRSCITVNASIVALPALDDAASTGVASSRLASPSIVVCGEPCLKPLFGGDVE